MKCLILFLIAVFLVGCNNGGNNPASPFVNPNPQGNSQHSFITQWGGNSSGSNDLSDPVALVANSNGTTIYIADETASYIKAFTPSGSYQFEWFVSLPVGLAIDGSNNVYVSSADGNNILEKFSGAGQLQAQGGGTGTGSGTFNSPIGLASEGVTLFVADSANNLVQGVTFINSGTTPSSGLTGLFQWTGSTSGANFSACQGVAVNSAGTTVYVLDTGNNCVKAFSSSGAYLTQWGTNGINQNQFSTPRGIAVDPNSGNVYVTDTGNNRVQEFSSSGSFVYQWGGSGTGAGKFNTPVGITVDSSGNIYVADSGNQYVQKFGP